MTTMVRSEINPLPDYELFRTRDPSAAQESAMRVTAPHRLLVRGSEADFAAIYHAVQVGPVAVCVQSYGAEIAMDRPGCDTVVSIVVPLMGEVELERRGREYVATAGDSMLVLSPGHGGTHLRWRAGTVVMSLKADSEALSRALRWIDPQADDRPFTALSPLVTGLAIRPVTGTIQLFTEVFSRYSPRQALPLPLAKQLREQALATMWLSVPNNHTEMIYRGPQAGKAATVHRVVDLIAAESRAERTVPELARAVNISVRGLELAFRRELDETPQQYLHRARLERARDDLRNLGPSEVSVTEIAHRWGFGHLGRFAARYRAQFGEMPSETLAAASH